MNLESLSSRLHWTPSSGYPDSTTTTKSIATEHVPDLALSLSNAVASLATQTYRLDLISLSQAARGAQASLTAISAQQVLATATDSSVLADATEALFHASWNLKVLKDDRNNYHYELNRGGNIFFFIVFCIIFVYTTGMLVWSRYHWYNITFFCGFALQVCGFLGRILAFSDTANLDFYLLQFVSLTLSPAFIMAGVYFLFAQAVILYGRSYSVLKPMWYSYFFITTDFLSLVVQGAGGGAASIATKEQRDPSPGTWTMFGGVLFQVIAMSIFLIFWFEFLNRLYYKDASRIEEDHPMKKWSIMNSLKLLFHTKSARIYKEKYLEPFYNPRYKEIRSRSLVPYLPLALTTAVITIYIRCIYRVVELKQGFNGYLIRHEVFLMTLDASMVAIAGLIFIPFHPVLVFGKKNVLRLATIKRNRDEDNEEKGDLTKNESSENERKSSDSPS
ncbi:hypothetical protein FT663_05293 [Candidozyma haemuli var. vulneris]|uniref:Sphingoid long-chain base transporter RSB1 n=1 Tax=Candidozyma haemuli TaxID=45357 RepID=A0A2V1ASD0_9ASCO|nr:hypothetical protein CXQ85_000092 [[Candida] haemuloni]KAF3985454.1 hypothetical protein FT663_05293 [[Candida] haemuloni var. vulneris]KAF3989320.1 hypothetical protein FT662_02871 [[Candida] haemuloni var. vulneris]PVH21127.1 hypothetical protein CXQ85_000092 [[Candida] haemuloni]